MTTFAWCKRGITSRTKNSTVHTQAASQGSLPINKLLILSLTILYGRYLTQEHNLDKVPFATNLDINNKKTIALHFAGVRNLVANEEFLQP